MHIKFIKDARYVQNNPADCKEYKAGETYEVSDNHGNRWIRRQLATEVIEMPKRPVRPEPKNEAKTEAKDSK